MGKENLRCIHPNEKIGSDAYRMENLHRFSKEAIKKDTITYLNEYRLKKEKDDYLLSFKDNQVCNPFSLEPMTEAARRSIELRKREGKPTAREKAELIAFQEMSDLIKEGENGDTLLWLSPPGPKDQGYGDYGFVFRGVIEKTNSFEGQIKMTAYRIENPQISQFNSFFSELTGENTFYLNAERFLESPRVIKGFGPQKVEDSLLSNFDFRNDPRKEKLCNQIINELSPVIDHFIEVVKTGNKEEKVETLNSLENMALELKKTYEYGAGNSLSLARHRLEREDIKDLINVYKYDPPKAVGSCGSSSSNLESNNPLNRLLKGGMEDQYGSLTFECPHCNQTNTRPKGKLVDNCQHCGKSVRCDDKEKGKIIKFPQKQKEDRREKSKEKKAA